MPIKTELMMEINIRFIHTLMALGSIGGKLTPGGSGGTGN